MCALACNASTPLLSVLMAPPKFALRLHSSGVVPPRPRRVIRLGLQSLFTSLLSACCGSAALDARVLVRISDAACHKHVLALVPCLPGPRPGQPTFKGIRLFHSAHEMLHVNLVNLLDRGELLRTRVHAMSASRSVHQ